MDKPIKMYAKNLDFFYSGSQALFKEIFPVAVCMFGDKVDIEHVKAFCVKFGQDCIRRAC